MYKIAHNMHYSTVVVLLLLLLVVLVLAPFVRPIATGRMQAGCDDGTIDAGICFVAEIGGLVTPSAEAQEVAP